MYHNFPNHERRLSQYEDRGGLHRGPIIVDQSSSIHTLDRVYLLLHEDGLMR